MLRVREEPRGRNNIVRLILMAHPGTPEPTRSTVVFMGGRRASHGNWAPAKGDDGFARSFCPDDNGSFSVDRAPIARVSSAGSQRRQYLTLIGRG